MFFFFFNDTATTEIYTLSLHDALPICAHDAGLVSGDGAPPRLVAGREPSRALCGLVPDGPRADRKSTRLNSSHSQISYAVFCLKKKKTTKETRSVDVDYTERKYAAALR